MRARAGWALAVAVGLATAVTPRPPALPAPPPVIVRAAGYGAAELELPVRPPAVPNIEHRTARATPPAGDVTLLALADCESGGWLDGGRAFVAGSARWDATDGPFSGAHQWLPSSWSAFRAEGDPAEAWQASPAAQLAAVRRYVAYEQAQGRGGYGPWPTCAGLLGLAR